ncbi:hypothetical protein ACJX0J_025949 [Zea mays]
MNIVKIVLQFELVVATAMQSNRMVGANFCHLQQFIKDCFDRSMHAHYKSLHTLHIKCMHARPYDMIVNARLNLGLGFFLVAAARTTETGQLAMEELVDN